MGLGEKIRKLRIAAKLTQMEFAEMCGVTTQAIQKWENGSYSPSLEKLVLLSKHFLKKRNSHTGFSGSLTR